jgi:autotransporter translocation and assembly factor TamB
VTLAGRHNFRNQALDLDLKVNIEDLRRYEPLVQPGISGQANIAGHVSGTIRRPKAHLTLQLHDARYDQYHASHLTTDIEVNPSSPSTNNPFQHFRFRSEGLASGIEPVFQGIPIGNKIDWNLIALVDGKQLSIEKIELKCEAGALEGSGLVDLTQADFNMDAMISIPHLHPLSNIIQTDIKGRGLLRNRLEGNFREKRISAFMEGRLEDLQFDDPRLSSLVGKNMVYQSRMTGSLPNHLSLEAFQITTSGIEAKAWSGSMDLSTGAMQGGGQIRIPALGAFSTMIGRQMEGPLDATVNVGGTLQSPRLKAEASSPHIVVNGFDCRDISVAVEGQDLGKRPKGRYTIRLDHEKQRLEASGDYELDPERVHLSDLILNAPAARFNGDLEIRFDPVAVTGSLNGAAQDLSPLSPFLGEQIRGDAILDARFSKGDADAQDINMDFTSRALAIGSVDFKDIKIKLKLADAFGTPGGTASINVARLSKGDLTFEAASFTAEGRQNRASFQGEASGRFRRPFEIRTDGSFLQTAGQDRLDIDTITGRFGNLPFKLAEPLRLVHQNRQLTVDKAALSIGSGLLKLSGGVQTNRIDLETTLKDFPIQALHAFGGPEFAGTASGQARLTGPLAGPRGVLAVQLQDLRLPDPAYQEIPPVTLHLNATLAEGSLQARLDAKGLGESPILARLSAPIVFSLSPFSLTTVGDGKIDGKVTASLPLEPIPGYLQWEGQKLAGRLHAALDLGGTSDSPALTGTVEIKEGMYEHSAAGTVVRDLALILGLDGDRITVKEGRATDGAEGGMQLTGWMDINPKAGFLLETDIRLQKMSMVRHDDLSVQTSGRIQLAGTLRELFFRGTMGIEQAELRIPEKLPPDIANMEVTEINQPDGRVRQKPKTGKPVIIALDLSVDIPGRAFVRGRGLDSEWKGGLKVAGTTTAPVLMGNLSVVRGHFDFFSKQFTLRKGTLLFDGAAPPSPRFDVTAEYKRKDLTAYVDLSGTPDNPQINLRSNPQYPSDEILARILFGRSASGITPVQALKLANAISALSGGGSAFDVMDRTRKSIGIDTLDIKQAEGTEGGTAAAVGKYLGDNVYMEVEKGLGAETGKVTVEVEVTPNLSVESEAGADASGGVGVNWKWDY